jgi:Tfp pilus assembly protein PilF
VSRERAMPAERAHVGLDKTGRPRLQARMAVSAASAAALCVALFAGLFAGALPPEPSASNPQAQRMPAAAAPQPGLATSYVIALTAPMRGGPPSAGAAREGRLREAVATLVPKLPNRPTLVELAAAPSGTAARLGGPAPDYRLDLALDGEDEDQTLRVKLFHAAGDHHFWSGELMIVRDGHASDEEVALALVRRLHTTIVLDRSERARPEEGPAALIRRGWGAMASVYRGERGMAARDPFLAALEAQPRNAGAMIGDAAVLVYAAESLQAAEPAGDLAEARNRLERARGIDASNPLTPYFLGFVHLRGGRADLAEREFRLAVDLNPTNAMAHAGLGMALSLNGDPAAGLERAKMAYRLNPADGFAGLMLMQAGHAALMLRHDEEALRLLTLAARRMPRSGPAKLALAALHALRGEPEAARRQIADYEALALMPAERAAAWLAAGPELARLREGLMLALALPR